MPPVAEPVKLIVEPSSGLAGETMKLASTDVGGDSGGLKKSVIDGDPPSFGVSGCNPHAASIVLGRE